MNRKDDGTVILNLLIPWKNIEVGYEKEIERLVKNAELPGFRKGKAPRKDVESRLNKAEVYGEAVRAIIPVEYERLLKEHNLKPIIYPRVKIKKAEIGQDWEFEITTCEKPVDGNIPQILVEEEANYRLGALSENLTKVGLTIDKFLQSKKMTLEEYRAQTVNEARDDLKKKFLV